MFDWNSVIQQFQDDAGSYCTPPGCSVQHAPMPSGQNGCCTIGVVHEHRFAFYYWALFSVKYGNPPPVLLTIDYHNDIGTEDDVRPNDLVNININNRLELSLYSWLCLRHLNDGHISPALYLNFFSDTYALMSKDEEGGSWEFTPEYRQMNILDFAEGNHLINHLANEQEALETIDDKAPVFLDIDLDYFTRENPATGKTRGSEIRISDNEIVSFFSKKRGLIQTILPRVVGMTIALEPKYCGGLTNSLHIFELLNHSLFDGSIFTDNFRWKHLGNE